MKRLVVALMLVALAGPAWAQGFGADTRGGSDFETRHVTTLADDGSPGSFRMAILADGGRVVFDVAGDFWINGALGPLDVGNFVTIDGTTAPYPGISIIGGQGLRLVNKTDVIVRSIRLFGSQFDNIQIRTGSRRILVERVTVGWAADGNIDITDGAHDITVRDSYLMGPDKNMLINTGARRVSVLGNLMVGSQRNPQARGDACPGPCADDTLVEMIGNVVVWWNANGHGLLCWFGAKCLVHHNWFGWTNGGTHEAAIRVRDGGIAHVRGNLSVAIGAGVNTAGFANGGIAMPTGLDSARLKGSGARVEGDVCANWWRVIRFAGAQGPDWVDQGRQWMTAPPCPEP